MNDQDSHVEQEQGFLSHLVELRDRLVKMILSVGILFLCLFWFSDEIYTYLANPLLRHMPDGQMIAIDVAAPFFIPFKLTLMLCIFLAVPYLLYQVWAFVAPGLYTHEKKLVVPLLVSSTLLCIAFEVPVATVLVVAVGITTPEQLAKIRPYVFVVAFVIGMFLTPPDIISQTLLAIPMWLLYVRVCRPECHVCQT